MVDAVIDSANSIDRHSGKIAMEKGSVILGCENVLLVKNCEIGTALNAEHNSYTRSGEDLK